MGRESLAACLHDKASVFPVRLQRIDVNVLVTLWKTIRNCRYVEKEPVTFYRNPDGVPGSVAVYSAGTDSGVALSE